jgi:hypothetical protein
MEGVPAVTINMFEGARRIAKLIAVFVVVGFGIAIVTNSAETVDVRYAIAGPGQPPVKVESCPIDSATKAANLDSNHSLSVTLCFFPMEFSFRANDYDGIAKAYGGKDSGKKGMFDDLIPRERDLCNEIEGAESCLKIIRLIPYGFDPTTRNFLGGHRDHSQVSAYIAQTAANFRIPPADEKSITALWWSQKIRNAGVLCLVMFATLAGFWAFTWVIGWIVRGFLGIPRGSDSRPA